MGSPLLYGAAVCLVVVAGYTHMGEVRLNQLEKHETQRAFAGEETFQMLKMMLPATFALSQILLFLVVYIMTTRIGPAVSWTFFGAVVVLVLSNSIVAVQHKRILGIARRAASLIKR